jgi:3-oxoacyl-[acyl-carrier protein] reductase
MTSRSCWPDSTNPSARDEPNSPAYRYSRGWSWRDNGISVTYRPAPNGTWEASVTGTKDIRLDGKHAIVTGAASGLGRAMATALLGAGANVAFLDIDDRAAGKVAEEARGAPGGGRALAVACDITSSAECANAVEQTARAFGGLHILVNCAARGNIHVMQSPRTRSMRFWEADPEVWTKVITTNVNGHYLMAHHCAPYMVQAGWGRIVNVTTSLATMQRVRNSPYSVSKVAMEGATIVWAKDLEGTGVTCNSLIPGGAVDTPFLEPDSRVQLAGRLLQPEIVVAPMLWLASDLSNGVSGGRFVGKLWDDNLPPAEAAEKAREAPVVVPVPPGTR